MIVGLIIVIAVLENGGSEEKVEETLRSVSVRSVLELSSGGALLPLFGVVQSKSEAIVRTETSGEVVNVYHSLGDNVGAGAVVAEMGNSSERANVLQAQAMLEVAEAALAKVEGSVRGEQLSILQTNVTSAQNALDSAETSAANAILSAYDTVDDSIRRKADQTFDNPTTSNPTFSLIITDSQLEIKLENDRPKMQIVWERHKLSALTITDASNAALVTELGFVDTELRSVRTFLDSLASALNKTIPDSTNTATVIDGYKTDVATARTNVNTALSSISSARDTLSAKVSALDVARKNLEQGVTGGQEEDITSAKAGVRQAEGGVAVARAALEKTIIRAPISGTINLLSIVRGDFVSAFTHVLTVANNNALEVIAYVSESDVRTLAVGAKGLIEGRFEGVVTKVAPAADPTTKRIEVRIGLTNGNTLINGQAVSLTIERTQAAPQEDIDVFAIPIAALKVETGRTVVFSVNEDGTLLAHPITIGRLLGDRVEIESGLTPEVRIVLDARGLKEGQKVIVR